MDDGQTGSVSASVGPGQARSTSTSTRKAKGKQRSSSINDGNGNSGGASRSGSGSASGSGSGSGSGGSGKATAFPAPADASGLPSAPAANGAGDNSFALPPTDYGDTSIRSGTGGGEEKKTRKQVQNRTAQRRYRGRQAEYVKQLETEIELLKGNPDFRESVKDEWIRKLQEDNRQLKAFILGPHRINLTEGIDVLLRKSYSIDGGILQPFISSPVVEAAPLLADGAAPASGPERSSFQTSNDGLGLMPLGSEEQKAQVDASAVQFRNMLVTNDFTGATDAANGASTELAHNSGMANIAPGTLFLNHAPLPGAAVSSFTGVMSGVPANSVPAAPTIDQYALRLPPSMAQPPAPNSFAADMNHFLASSAMDGGMGIPWQATGSTAVGAHQFGRTDAMSTAPSQQTSPRYQSTSHAPAQLYQQAHQPQQSQPSQSQQQQQQQQPQQHQRHPEQLSHQYPDLSRSLLHEQLVSPTSASHYADASGGSGNGVGGAGGGMVANRNNSDDATSSGLRGDRHNSNDGPEGDHRAGSGGESSRPGATPRPEHAMADDLPVTQKRRKGGYLGMSHKPTAESGIPGGKSGGDGGPAPTHVLPAQLYSQREQLSAMIRHVFEAPGQGTVDFSSPDFSYEPYQHRLEPIFRFCWSWAMAIGPEEPEMEVAGMAWIIFLFSNAAVNFYLKLPEFLQPTREQQSLPHEAAVMFVPWKDLRNQMVLLDGFVNFRIVGELVNCMSLQMGQYKRNAGPVGAPKHELLRALFRFISLWSLRLNCRPIS